MAEAKGIRNLLELFSLNKGHRFLFAPGGKEAIEKVFISTYLDRVRSLGRNQILTWGIEAPCFKQLDKWGCVLKTLPVDAHGHITKAALEEAIRPRTALVSLAWADPLTGVIQPIQDLAEVCQKKEVRLHIDASQVLGRLWLNLEELPFDFLTFDGEALRALPATGGIFVKKEIDMEPFTENPEGEEFLEETVRDLLSYQEYFLTEVARLKERMEKRILSEIPGSAILYEKEQRLPHVFAAHFPYVHAQSLQFFLSKYPFKVCRTESVFDLSFTLPLDLREKDADHMVDLIVSSASKLRSLGAGLQ